MSTPALLFDPDTRRPWHMSEGELRKRAGMARADEAEQQEWKDRADAAIRTLASSGRDFTAEDVRALAGDPSHPNAFGARFGVAARAGLIRCVGRRVASRPSLHGHEIRVWRGQE